MEKTGIVDKLLLQNRATAPLFTYGCKRLAMPHLLPNPQLSRNLSSTPMCGETGFGFGINVGEFIRKEHLIMGDDAVVMNSPTYELW